MTAQGGMRTLPFLPALLLERVGLIRKMLGVPTAYIYHKPGAPQIEKASPFENYAAHDRDQKAG